jgi:hypothetical protein
MQQTNPHGHRIELVATFVMWTWTEMVLHKAEDTTAAGSV